MHRQISVLSDLIVLFLFISIAATAEELRVSHHSVGQPGGRLISAQRAEPRTLNPVNALDVVSRELIGLMTADLIHIDRKSFQTVPALAKKWNISEDGRIYTLYLRQGLRFSDGHPFSADDVVFTFQVHTDEKVRSPQRELLIIGGKPIVVRKIDSHTVRVELAKAHPAAERLFDSIGILPRHLLEKAYQDGKLASVWGLTASPTTIAGLGPFRLKEYIPGQHLVLERNPHYWQVDQSSTRLPYLDELVFVFTGTEDAQVLRFASGELHIIADVSPENFGTLERQRASRGIKMLDLGPGLEYSFLLLNQNDLSSGKFPSISEKQAWFRRVAFRQAISTAIDRESIVRLAHHGMATPLCAHVTQGNKQWVNTAISCPGRSVERARQLLKAAGFTWNEAGKLLDDSGKEVTFSILTSAGNSQRSRIAAIIQDDLKQLGMAISIVSLEFRAMLDRIFNTHEYEAAVMTLASGDTDPNAEMNVWTTKGSTHLWNLNGAPQTDWEKEIDQLMRQQLVELDFAKRKRLYDQVQQLVSTNLPIICISGRHILVGAAKEVQNLQPSILRPYVLWNADQLYLQQSSARKQ